MGRIPCDEGTPRKIHISINSQTDQGSYRCCPGNSQSTVNGCNTGIKCFCPASRECKTPIGRCNEYSLPAATIIHGVPCCSCRQRRYTGCAADIQRGICSRVNPPAPASAVPTVTVPLFVYVPVTVMMGMVTAIDPLIVFPDPVSV